jgi:hypothetical protein
MAKNLRVRLLAAATVNGKRSHLQTDDAIHGWPDPAAMLVKGRMGALTTDNASSGSGSGRSIAPEQRFCFGFSGALTGAFGSPRGGGSRRGSLASGSTLR